MILQDEKQQPYAKVEITCVFRPVTISPVMAVVIDPGTTGAKAAVLRLYDRRYAEQLCDDKGIAPWTPAHDQQYARFVMNGGAAEFLSKLNDDNGDNDDDPDNWNTAQDETYLLDYCRDLYKSETAVYQTLEDLG